MFWLKKSVPNWLLFCRMWFKCCVHQAKHVVTSQDGFQKIMSKCLFLLHQTHRQFNAAIQKCVIESSRFHQRVHLRAHPRNHLRVHFKSSAVQEFHCLDWCFHHFFLIDNMITGNRKIDWFSQEFVIRFLQEHMWSLNKFNHPMFHLRFHPCVKISALNAECWLKQWFVAQALIHLRVVCSLMMISLVCFHFAWVNLTHTLVHDS